MNYPRRFIAATTQHNTFDHHVNAPYLRKTFNISSAEAGRITICGLGFYELYINGTNITKGHIAPYISASDDLVYYDEYDVKPYLKEGVNAVGILLGNGMQNNPGGKIWSFDSAAWVSAPKVAMRFEGIGFVGRHVSFESDATFKVHPSPITFDDLRAGEFYDARLEIADWSRLDFDDSAWEYAIEVETPRGEPVLCSVPPVVTTHELRPVSITGYDGGYLYDFGENWAGVCRLRISGEAGQTVNMVHGEHLTDGKLNLENVRFRREGYEFYDEYTQKVKYTCKGSGAETYMPHFTYFGFQYVYVTGITPEQATPELLTYCVMNSRLDEVGNFSCSDETVNTLQKLTRRSTLANFYYFPTDCPHREKNGWTGDAALSAEHILMNLSAEAYFKEWLRNIRKAQNGQGALPGVVPTGGWGFAWGNGPAWDAVLTYLPYYTYLYRGDREILSENATAIFRYINYLTQNVRPDGLIKLGLGDWCQPDREAEDCQAPIELTDSVVSMDICNKAAFIFDELGMALHSRFAKDFAATLRKNIRAELIEMETMTARGDCQGSQAMMLYYGIFEESEKPAAFAKLLALIEADGNKMNTGILGARVIFHVLSEYGRGDLAFEMITTPDFPSYGNWIARGATSLWEDFQKEGAKVASKNHHFFGDISNWFISRLAGIRYNPHRNNLGEADICPDFIATLDNASAYYASPKGKISAAWKRENGAVMLDIEMPAGVSGNILLPAGYVFEDGSAVKEAVSGVYKVVAK